MEPRHWLLQDQPRLRKLLRRTLEWHRHSTVFVNSMSDLFHDDVPDDFVRRVFATMQAADQHRFQVLTKRSGRLRTLAEHLPWPENVWAGVSVESAAFKWRIDELREVPAAVRFLSVEPLLGPLPDLDLDRIDWVIVGGESGPHARPPQPDWVRDVRDQCLAARVPLFFKQWRGTRKEAAGRLLDGRVCDEMPVPRVLLQPQTKRRGCDSTMSITESVNGLGRDGRPTAGLSREGGVR